MSFPNPNIPSGRAVDGDVFFGYGMDSQNDPVKLAPGQYCRGINVVNRGGIVQCRPGHRCKMALPVGNLQGAAFFLPALGNPVMLFAVEGLIYLSETPYTEFRQIPGIAFLPHVRQIFFQQVVQSVRINEDGSLSFITPRNLLVIQDGGYTRPAVFDGSTAEHTAGIPLGGPMSFLGDRLWVARENKLFASDLANPLSFVEFLYITSAEFFILPEPITALSRTPGVPVEELLVFTAHTTSLIKASIRDRASWIVTPNFQRILFPKLGCVANRSVVAHWGLLWWFSEYGLTNFDAASQAFVTSKLPYKDGPMIDSKARLSDDIAGIAGIAVENYLLMSVPYSDPKNLHTWCLDQGAVESLKGAVPELWNSVWTGTRPVEWLSAIVNGKTEVYHISVDVCGCNTLWLSFTPDRLDNYCEITWAVETRAYLTNDVLTDNQIRWADVYFSELFGTVDVAIFWAGAKRGKYKRVMTKRIQAERCALRYFDRYCYPDILYSLKKQSRKLRTQDAREIYQDEKQTSCGVERETDGAEFIDESFQLLIVGSGPGAVDAIKLFTDPESGDKLSGFCEEDETDVRAVRFDGAAEHDADYETAMAKLGATCHELPFRATRTATITVGDDTAYGIGVAESIISMQDAVKVADCIAMRVAAKRLEAVLPSTVSQGMLV